MFPLKNLARKGLSLDFEPSSKFPSHLRMSWRWINFLVMVNCWRSNKSESQSLKRQGLLLILRCPDSKVHGAHLEPTGSRWAPCWPHELCYLGGAENRIIERTRSVPWMMMPWLLVLPGHQQPWYQLDKWVLTFHEERFQQPAPCQCWEILDYVMCFVSSEQFSM